MYNEKSMSICLTPCPGEKADMASWVLGKKTKVLANVLQNTGTRAASVKSVYICKHCSQNKHLLHGPNTFRAEGAATVVRMIRFDKVIENAVPLV